VVVIYFLTAKEDYKKLLVCFLVTMVGPFLLKSVKIEVESETQLFIFKETSQ